MNNVNRPSSCSDSNDQALGCDDFNNDMDPRMVCHNIMMELDDFHTEAEDLFSDIDGREFRPGAPAPLTMAKEFAPRKVSNGSNDDISYSDERDSFKPFPALLHSIVSDEATDSAIQWLPCGKRFVVSDKQEFSKNILPLYFGGRGRGDTTTTKFTSFTRRLKRWNFSRIPAGKEIGAYYHEYFQRDKPELVKKIVYPMSSPTARAKSGGMKIGRRASTGSTPLLMSMPELCISPCISPAPIKNTFSEDDLVDEMNMWLSSSPAFDLEGASLPPQMGNKRYNTNPCPVVHASSAFSDPAFLLAPPRLPRLTASEALPTYEGSKVRRHSCLDLSIQRAEDLRSTSRISRTPEAVTSKDSLSMSFSPNDVFSTDDTLNMLPSQHKKDNNGDRDDSSDMFAWNFRNDNMNAANPFT